MFWLSIAPSINYIDPMQDDFRPDPDALLAGIRKQDEQSRRGRLKVFFGMCPGVGKTYAMLLAAREQRGENVEVLVGLVETHGRKETIALLEGMPVAERARLEYKGTTLEEMDLDAILMWHPQLVIVDELAHTNAPGSRHAKRFQDVLELLDAGIDVYTTLNVQHVESRKDTVRQITGIEVRETVPDKLLDLAEEITLIDLTPSQLRTRLAEGKVYLGERAATAAENFFRESNLIALREMALRLTAEHVDRDLRQIKPASVTDPWKAGDRLLVAISASPSSEKLIRWARRAAATMEASWVAGYVETPVQLSVLDQVRLGLNLALARQLGAEVVITESAEVGPSLLRIARQHNVSQIIVGKPGPRRQWEFFRSSPVAWLVENSGDIDVHMVRAEEPAAKASASFHRFGLANRIEYGFASGIAGAITIAGLLLESITGYWAIALIYLLGVIVAGTRLSRWPTLFLATISAALWDFLFIPPKYTFYIREVRDFMMLGMYFIVAVIVGHLTTRLREREIAERRGQDRAFALYRLTQALAGSESADETVAAAIRQIKETFGMPTALMIRDEAGAFTGRTYSSGTLALGEKEESVAAWTFRMKQAAGRFTDTLPDSEALYLPLLAGETIAGVLAVRPEAPLIFQERELLEAFASQIAVSVEKNRLAQANRCAMVVAQSEQLQRTLFDSVSHELKTPLAAISAALEQSPDSPVLNDIRQATARLTKVVNHLLDMTRLDSGLLKPNLEWCDPGDLVREALDEAREQTASHRVTIEAPSGVPMIRADPRLMTQVLTLLIANAANYSPAGSEVLLSLNADGERLRISIADQGPGLKNGDEERVFEKFYRSPGTPAGGIGLGLSIAKRLVEAHAGSITAGNRSGGGALFVIELPAKECLHLPDEPRETDRAAH